MTTILPTTQPESIAATGGRHSSPEAGLSTGEDFNATLARRQAAFEPTLRAPSRPMPNGQDTEASAATNGGARDQTGERFPRTDGRFQQSLKTMARPHLVDESSDIVEETLPGGEVRSPSSDHTPQQLVDASSVSAMAPKLIGDPLAARSGGAQPGGKLSRTIRDNAIGGIDSHVETGSLSRGSGISSAISGTSITVREQQTHFARDPLGQSDFASKLNELSTTTTVQTREILKQGVSQTHAKIDETVQLEHLQTESDADQLIDFPEPPAPATQVVSKILEVIDEESAPSQKSSTGLLPAPERPLVVPTRVIRIELSPGSLGVIHVTLKNANAALSISIEAERPQTAASLGADQAALRARLTESGYPIDAFVVTTADRALDVASPVRAEQPSGLSNGALSAGTDSQRREADESWKRPRPEQDRHSHDPGHSSAQSRSESGAELRSAPLGPWRGRHQTRSV